MEIVLPGNMTVMESHDIALDLQHKIESLADVERAFVHVSDIGLKVEKDLQSMWLISLGGSSTTRWIGT